MNTNQLTEDSTKTSDGGSTTDMKRDHPPLQTGAGTPAAFTRLISV